VRIAAGNQVHAPRAERAPRLPEEDEHGRQQDGALVDGAPQRVQLRQQPPQERRRGTWT